jgi:AmiR/NasT family two-component response regulator
VAVRVVIAEDEAIVRLDLAETLRDAGYEVVAATGRGDEAVELVREHRPDLAVLDVKMPGMDGIAAARAIWAERMAAVLILTAFSQKELVEQARDAGAMAYVVKPFQRSDLVPQIEVALARFAELKALEAENAALEGRAQSLEEQLESRRAVERAKGVLMDRHGMGEAQAFSFIQRSAMSSRRTMRAVAEDVLQGVIAPDTAGGTPASGAGSA